jgi:hypothetical protein
VQQEVCFGFHSPILTFGFSVGIPHLSFEPSMKLQDECAHQFVVFE